MSTPFTVSIFMIAYNQGQYIAEAIQSVLSQKCTFKYQLIIGEDCSTDNTRDICERFAEQYPEKITLLPSEKNLGIHANFLRTLQACSSAKYVAFCEGDDKWIDDTKLEQQVAFLERNPDYSAHTHNAVYKDLRDGSERNFGIVEDRPLTLDDLFNKWRYHPVTLIARASALRKIPYQKLPYFISADRFLSMWLGCQGTVYYEGTKTMSVYHRHNGGASANSTYTKVRNQNLNLLEFFQPYVNDKATYDKAVKGYCAGYYVALARNSEEIPCERNRTKDFINYAKRISFNEIGSNLYVLMLIAFGRKFYQIHEKRKNASAILTD